MKLYNPFKAHVIELASGKFVVRRRTLIGWEYKEHTTRKDEKIYWWFLPEFAESHCAVGTLEEAIRLRDKVKISPMKAVKVHG